MTPFPWVDRFWSKIDKTDTCWLWTGGKRGEYGIFNHDGGDTYAHRLSYALAKGPIPDGLEINHLCFATLCVNPAHLEAIPKSENLSRAKRKPKTRCAQGHPWVPENIGFNRWRYCLICSRVSKAKYKSRQKAMQNAG